MWLVEDKPTISRLMVNKYHFNLEIVGFFVKKYCLGGKLYL